MPLFSVILGRMLLHWEKYEPKSQVYFYEQEYKRSLSTIRRWTKWACNPYNTQFIHEGEDSTVSSCSICRAIEREWTLSRNWTLMDSLIYLSISAWSRRSMQSIVWSCASSIIYSFSSSMSIGHKNGNKPLAVRSRQLHNAEKSNLGCHHLTNSITFSRRFISEVQSS